MDIAYAHYKSPIIANNLPFFFILFKDWSVLYLAMEEKNIYIEKKGKCHVYSKTYFKRAASSN